jgi:nitrous oxidase accessory protein
MAGSQPGKISFLVFLSIVQAIAAQAATWKVGRGEAFQSIRPAVEKAAPKDTILVYPGKYFEKNLVIQKPLFLRGIGKPVLDGEKKYELISVFASRLPWKGCIATQRFLQHDRLRRHQSV